MTKPLTVFISSTADDLKRYRAAAAEVVRDAGWIADMMEHFPTDPDPIVVMCQRRVRECNLFLLIQAFRRGGVPDVTQGGDGETSYTAFELRAADQLSKPVLFFLADEDKWPGKLYEDESVARAWVKDFRNKVNRSGKFFGPEEGDLRQFKALVREAITHHKACLLDGSRQETLAFDARDQTHGSARIRAVRLPEWPDMPYPLLQPYTHPDTFAGRDEELRKLELLLRRPPLVLCLHAASGAGKSSLLRAGLLPRLHAAGFPVSLERRPGEPGLARRLVGDLLEIPSSASLHDDHPNLFAEFASWLERAGTVAGKPPILILDQVDDFLRQPDRRDETLARLGPLLAVTAQRTPGGHGFTCRWVLCYRHEFHGEIEEWLHDVLSQARRAGRTGIRELPHDLSDGERLHRWPVPLMGALQPSEATGDLGVRTFLRAIMRPLELRLSDGSPRYDVQFRDGGAERLALAFALARARQPHAPLVPELQVVLRHLLASARTGSVGETVVDVPEDAAELEMLINDALVKHLKEALDTAFIGGNLKAAKLGRARALLALSELADESGRRGEGLKRDVLIEMIGEGGELVLQKLSSPDMRLIVEEPRDGGFVCTLAHDRMAEVIVRLKKEGGGTLDVNRPVIELRTSVNLRSALYGGYDDSSLNLTPEQHALIAANIPALVRSHAERQWWQQSDAWFSLTQRLRDNPQSGFHALVELTKQQVEDWPRMLERLRSAEVSAGVFREGPWGEGAAHDAEEVLLVVERTHAAFLKRDELFRAMSYAVEETLRRRPDLITRVQALRATLWAALRSESAAGVVLPPLFQGDAWFLPDEPLLGFVEIPAGCFAMGSDPTTQSVAPDDETWSEPTNSQGRLYLPTFYLARYPVTVAQFGVFTEATNFRRGNAEGIKRDLEHPFVVVSWTEALEYSCWLEHTLQNSDTTPESLKQLLTRGYHVGLPSEAEWEKAARGTDGRIYPWGDTIDPSRANYLETRLGKTNPVGAFPSGASPYGILDMSGNVWEWTRSLLRPYPYDPADGREVLTVEGARVLRGGSFNRDHQAVRAASRSSSSPVDRGSRIGFRLVLSNSCS